MILSICHFCAYSAIAIAIISKCPGAEYIEGCCYALLAGLIGWELINKWPTHD